MRLLTLVASCVLVGGCADLSEQKRSSLAAWGGARVADAPGGVAARRYLAARSAVLLETVDGVASGEGMELHLVRNGVAASDASGGAAAAVDGKGYWLTAAHCVRREPVLLIASREGVVVAAPARVVWKGDPGMEGGDIAIVHAPATRGVPVMVLTARPAERGRVLCRGSGFGSGAWAAGEIVSVGGATDGSVGWINHTAPLGPGDSGGPAMLADGSLAGINVSIEGRGAARRSTAVWINPERVRAIVAQDKAERAVGRK